MSAENNKQLVRKVFEQMDAGDVDGYRASVADDCTHTVTGKSAMARTMNKAQVAEMLRGVEMIFPIGLKMTIKGMIAEGDRVAVEAESYGETADGKIQAIREHMCTAHAMEVLGRYA